MKNEIQEVLNEYVNKLNDNKAFSLSVSNYKVTKPWGYEIWLALNEFYAYKLIHMKSGMMSSLQSHVHKIETNYVISGKAKVLLEINGEMQEFIFEAGTGWNVEPGQKHRVISIDDYTALEVSTPHLNDVIRHEDVYNRNSGKINIEHV